MYLPDQWCPSPIKTWHVLIECYCHGDLCTNWDYILRGVCFGFKVIKDDCDSTYHKENYNSITKGEVGVAMCFFKDHLLLALLAQLGVRSLDVLELDECRRG